jgi:hypothetical protein
MTDDTPRPRCIVPHCPTPLEQWGICAHHITTTDQLLADLVDLHARAHTRLAPGTAGTHLRTVPGSRPPLDIAALDLALGEWLLMTDEDTTDPPWTGLEGWEQDWRTYLHLSPYGPATARRAARGMSTLVGVVTFLRAWWPRAAELHPAADEFVADVRRMHAAAKAALRESDPPAWSVACPTDGCGNRLRVEHDGRDAVLRCKRCGVARTTEHLLYVARAEGKPCWLDAEAAARALRCDVGHLGPLVRDGRLRVRGMGECRQYDINSLRMETTA